ncbi:flagellar biosynthesis protein FlhF [Neomoorella mulderi]|uniref:Flagellar biosynthesis protein FlhF n=1 Tax=Moorella mulderi DSM 14980 TaxID=1122241 RepID=A0A151AYB1_9FIRM|nr:flagellar biosynthesis protein FlhF [Moorella mulderi]KYH32649.1 flagellar biosynthesis protein FlhF [Moorella mulderi DSM 14980]
MKIKRYLARDMQEAYLAIRRDLGPEAVIVATRQVRQPGLKGFFLPPRLEVTAALEEAPERRLSQPEAPAGKAALQPGNGKGEVTPAGAVSPAGGRNSGRYGLEGLQRELAEIKAALNRLVRPGSAPVPEHLLALRQRLLAQELEEELVALLLDGIETTGGTEIIGDVIRSRLADHLSHQVASQSRQRVQAFIGPTGVGKTTTLAKIAARYSLYQEQKVGLITLDTYRIGAVDQLKTYAEIMGLPLEVAMTPRELRASLENLKHCDVVLVDTAGRAPENKAMLAETRGFLEVVPEREVYLVLSCATRRQDLLRAVENFRSLKYNRLIFTKLDETSCPGVMLTVAAAAGVPLAYITTGQDVPDDLEPADPHLLARRIWEAVAKDGPGGQAA